MSVYENIRTIAKERGMSLQKVAELAGLSQNMIYQYKKVNPKMDTLNRLSEVLNVSVEYLLGESERPTLNAEPTDDLKKYFEEHHIVRYDGKPIPDSDLEVIKRILESN